MATDFQYQCHAFFFFDELWDVRGLVVWGVFVGG